MTGGKPTGKRGNTIQLGKVKKSWPLSPVLCLAVQPVADVSDRGM